MSPARSPSPFLAPGRARGRSPTRKELFATCGTTLGTARIGQTVPAIVSSRTTPANEDCGEDVALQERSLSLQGDAPPAMPLGIETCSGYEAATKSMLLSEAPCASQEKPGQVEARQFFLPKSRYLWRLLLLPALMVYAALHGSLDLQARSDLDVHVANNSAGTALEDWHVLWRAALPRKVPDQRRSTSSAARRKGARPRVFFVEFILFSDLDSRSCSHVGCAHCGKHLARLCRKAIGTDASSGI